jgi:co-chaperonin GroES (HSP10)
METLKDTNLKLQGTRVIVRPIGPFTSQEVSSLIKGVESSNDLHKGTVEAVGVDVTFVKVGDTVVYNYLSGNGITYNGEVFKLTKEDGIVGVVPNEN